MFTPDKETAMNQRMIETQHLPPSGADGKGHDADGAKCR